MMSRIGSPNKDDSKENIKNNHNKVINLYHEESLKNKSLLDKVKGNMYFKYIVAVLEIRITT